MALTEKQLAQHAAGILDKRRAGVLAYSWHQPWAGSDRIDIRGTAIPVDYCESVLQVRESLTRDPDKTRILLVSVETGLGHDVLARIHGHQLLHIDRWMMLEEACGTMQIDARLYASPWIADALLESSIARLDRTNITALTYERAVELCLTRFLDCSPGQLELEDLLSACERSGRAWAALTQAQKDVYTEFLKARFGGVAAALLGALTAGHGQAVVSMGLACEVLYGERSRANSELRDSQVRLEAYLDGQRISEADGRRWAEAAERVLRSRSDPERAALLSSTTELLRALGAVAHIVDSELLPTALDLRLEALGTAIQQFLRKRDQLGAVEQAAALVRRHGLTPADHPSVLGAEMVVALCRREASLPETPTPPVNIVRDYLDNGAWEDYARRVLRGVRPDAFARGVGLLLERVTARRQLVERRFAEQLADTLQNVSTLQGTLPVEAALDRLLVPLADHMPVLLLVLDGMSWDVYYGIARHLGREGWDGRRFDAGPDSLLATVPSVTECSRASLLCGQLARGASPTEKAAFAAHPGLLRAGSRGASRVKPPVLLHKAELTSGNQLSEAAVRVLSDSEQRVVGVVLNAVDDALSKSDQLRIDWSIESIPLLGAILAQARLGMRAIVITSDHGHVLEAQSQYRPAGDAERWRKADGRPVDGEIQVGGSRVRALMEGEIIVPWSERIRYGTKKNGYHGGVTRQEMLVPLGLWMPSPEVANQYTVYQPLPPDWWESRATGLSAPMALPRPSQTSTAAQERQNDLFVQKTETSWIEPLLASAVLAQQRERLGRIALDDDRLTRLLCCLEQRGGRATTTQLALSVEQAPLRMRGMISALQRMLNVDGYTVLTMETATGTVILDTTLLRKQFEL